jgi:RecA-family ATPase
MRDGRMQHIVWTGSGSPCEEKTWEEMVAIPTESLSDEYGQEFELNDLLDYDIANDPNIILGPGTRYLCKCGSLLIVGQSGIGKSSISVQMASRFALGLDFFGIAPARALRILIIQRENDAGDVAEEMQGVFNGMQYDGAQRKELKRNLKVVRSNVGSGGEWVKWAERKVIQHHADVLIIDPLLSFSEGDLSKQEHATKFLRHELQPMLNRTQTSLICMHHTPKPKSAKDSATGQGVGNYMGAGSAEITNWTRGIITLTEECEGVYVLCCEKRGKRAGLVDIFGAPARKIYLKHADDGVYWERTEAPVASQDGAQYIHKAKLPKQLKSIKKEYKNAKIDFSKMPRLYHHYSDRDNSELVPWVKEKLGLSSEGAIREMMDARRVNAIRADGPLHWIGVNFGR